MKYLGSVDSSQRYGFDLNKESIFLDLRDRTRGTFTRNSEASYQYATATDGTTPFLSWSQANERRYENRGDGYGEMLFVEGTRTNLLTRSREPSVSAGIWAVGGSPMSTASFSPSPDGLTSYRVKLTNVGTNYIYNPVPVTSGSNYVHSWWARPVIAGDIVEFRVAGGTTPVDQGIGENPSTNTLWKRWLLSASCTTTTTSNFYAQDSRAVGPFGTNGARDAIVDLMQSEAGFFPSSPIRTTTTSATRAADTLSFAEGEYPATFLTYGMKFDFAPDYSSDDIIAGQISTAVISFAGASSYVLIQYETGACKLRISNIGIPSLVQAITFSRGQLMQLIIEPRAGRITITGATTGNGTYTSTPWTWGGFGTDPNTFFIGPTGGLGNFYGRISPRIEALKVPPLPVVTVTGTLGSGSVLTAIEQGVVVSRQWQRGTVVDGTGTFYNISTVATSSTYTQVPEDVGYAIRCVSFGPNGGGNSGQVQWAVSIPGGLVADWNADSGVEVSSGTAAVNGNTAEFWRNRAAFGALADANQSSGPTARPTYLTGAGPNGHAGVYFSTSSGAGYSYLDTTGLSLSTPSVNTIAIVAQAPGAGRYFYDAPVANIRVLGNLSSGGEQGLYMYAGQYGPRIATGTTGDWIIANSLFSGANSKMTVNGGLTLTGNVGTDGHANHRIGCAGTVNALYTLSGSVSRHLIYTGSMSDINRANLDCYLMNWAGILDLTKGGTFTRTTEGSYLIAAPTDGTTGFLAWAPANTRRIENRGDGLGNMLLMEGSRTNQAQRSRDLTALPWGTNTNGTIMRTGSLSPATDGTATATRIFTAGGGWGFPAGYVGVMASPHVLSQYVRGTTVSGTLRFNYNASIQGRNISGTTWQRVEQIYNMSGSTWYPVDNTSNSGDAQDWLFDNMQLENGAFPSSPIRTTTAAVTRGADVLSYAVGQYPASFLTRGFRFRFAPDASSAEINTENVAMDLFRFGGSGNRVTVDVGGASNCRLTVEGASPGFPSITTGDIVFSRGQLLTIEIRPSAGEIVVSGATSGNGTTTGSAFPFDAGTLNVGNTAGVKPVFGRLGTTIEAL